MKKWVLIVIVLIVTILWWFFAFSQQKDDFKFLTYQEYISRFTTNLKTNNDYSIAGNNINRRGIVRSFCNNIFSDPELKKWFVQDMVHTYIYSPQDSVFMKLFCRNVNTTFGVNSNIPDAVIKAQWVWTWMDSNKKCNFALDLNWCDMSIRLSDIFHTIINDYTNIKIVWLFWNSSADLSDIKWQIQLFSNDYFGVCDGKEIIYLNKNTDKWYCNHPNTYNMLSNYIKKLNQNLAQTKIIDFTALEKIEWTWSLIKRAFVTDCNQEITSDKVWCGLNDFNNLVMNELMYYTMFLNFYNSLVPTSTQYMELTAWRWVWSNINIVQEEWFRTKLELEVANESVWSTLRVIRNLYTWFPVHVWLVAYLEDLVRFRDELIKLYTPIHQTYYKFRNIQVPD